MGLNKVQIVFKLSNGDLGLLFILKLKLVWVKNRIEFAHWTVVQVWNGKGLAICVSRAVGRKLFKTH